MQIMSETEVENYVTYNNQTFDNIGESTNLKEIKCAEFFLSDDFSVWRLKCVFCTVSCQEIQDIVHHIKQSHFEHKHRNKNNDIEYLTTGLHIISTIDTIKIESNNHENKEEDEATDKESELYMDEFFLNSELKIENESNQIASESDSETRSLSKPIENLKKDQIKLVVSKRKSNSEPTIDYNKSNSKRKTTQVTHTNQNVETKTTATIKCKQETRSLSKPIENLKKDQIKLVVSKRKSNSEPTIDYNKSNSKRKTTQVTHTNQNVETKTTATIKCREKKPKRIYSDTRCDICERNLLLNESVDKHRLYYHDFVDPFTNEISTIIESKRILPQCGNEIRRVDPCLCKFCSHRASSAGARVVHERRHTGERPYECKLCKKRFISEASYLLHQNTHDNAKKFACEICGILLKTLSNLSEHMLVHGERQFQCSYCSKKFLRKQDKVLHERVHTNERPYQCNECGKTFLRSTNLTAHARWHAGIKRYNCSYCDKKFFTNEMLKNHIVIHTGERPFSCDICLQTFPRKKGLKSHLKIHSDVRGYVCSICGKSYKQYSGLYVHKRSHGLVDMSSNIKQEKHGYDIIS